MKDEKLYLIHILECVGRIEDYTRRGRDAFMESTMAQDAVIRNFEIIGEAAKQIPRDFADGYPEVPWRRIAGFRDVLFTPTTAFALTRSGPSSSASGLYCAGRSNVS